MNTALIAKVGWRVLHDCTSLWARVVRSKYKVGTIHESQWTVAKGTWSSTWRSVGFGLRAVIYPGHSWVVGDGRSIRFWTDKWLSSKSLIDDVVGALPLGFEQLSVRDLWREEAGWDLTRIALWVSKEKRMELAAIVVDNFTGARDRLSWGESPDGKFTDMESFYRRVWKVVAPERVRTFLWMVSKQIIMTNSERARRHICDSDICTVCKGGIETIIHVLRDCPAMSGIWQRIVPPQRRHKFFTQTLLEWIYANLREGIVIDGISWATTFAMALWWGWKWRCCNVFGENRVCRDRVKFVKDIAAEVTKANVAFGGRAIAGARVERMIRWKEPSVGWFKLNTDGASRGNPGPATAGGVLRDENGIWCGGFALNIGRCSAPLAELWGVYYGLYMAWERKLTRIELEVDSEVVVGFLKAGIGAAHPLSFLVRMCHGFLVRDWIVRISHVYREANRLADGLANYAFSLPLGFHVFDVLPSSLVSVFREDESGTECPRQVRL
ncbi:putative ribonuclease H domain, reverse transcriptase zinc-binding domain-containing protein [Arabidopsis thaliana]